MYLYMYVHMYVLCQKCVYTSTYIFICIRISTCMCECLYLQLYVYIYTEYNTQKQQQQQQCIDSSMCVCEYALTYFDIKTYRYRCRTSSSCSNVYKNHTSQWVPTRFCKVIYRCQWWWQWHFGKHQGQPCVREGLRSVTRVVSHACASGKGGVRQVRSH